MKVRIVTIGDEILIGQIVDSNSAYIAQRLNEIGLEVEEILSIRDQPKVIIHALKGLTKNSDLLIVTGGLGPTKDDLTKKALAQFLKVDLAYEPEVLMNLEERFRKLNRPMNDLNRDQALIPEGSSALPNALGTAPGIWTEYNGCIIVNLAGVPFEMKNLMTNQVIPRLKMRFKLDYVVHRHLSVSHYPESDLSIALNDWENNLPKNLHLAYLPERGKVKLRITGKGKDRKKIEAQIEKEIKKLIPLLDQHLESTREGVTEMVLGEKLKHRKLTISTAESCTGGMIAHLLTSIPGSSAYFKGSIVSYATEVKENILGVPKKLIQTHSVVSEEVVKAMAEKACIQLKTDLAIATTGVAGPGKGEDGNEVGTVWIAVSNGKKTETKMYFFPYLERDDFILHVSKLALQKALDFIS